MNDRQPDLNDGKIIDLKMKKMMRTNQAPSPKKMIKVLKLNGDQHDYTRRIIHEERQKRINAEGLANIYKKESRSLSGIADEYKSKYENDLQKIHERWQNDKKLVLRYLTVIEKN